MPFLGEVLTARNIAPTLRFNYHFGDASARLRPSLGLGVNDTSFADAKTPDGWDVKLSSRWELAAHAGIDVAIDKPWGLFASIVKVKVKTDLVAIGAAVLRCCGAAVLRTTIDDRRSTAGRSPARPADRTSSDSLVGSRRARQCDDARPGPWPSDRMIACPP